MDSTATDPALRSQAPHLAIRVALVDDRDVVRAGARSILVLAGDIAVVAEAATADDAVAAIVRTTPDVAIVDVNLPGTRTRRGRRSPVPCRR